MPPPITSTSSSVSARSVRLARRPRAEKGRASAMTELSYGHHRGGYTPASPGRASSQRNEASRLHPKASASRLVREASRKGGDTDTLHPSYESFVRGGRLKRRRQPPPAPRPGPGQRGSSAAGSPCWRRAGTTPT